MQINESQQPSGLCRLRRGTDAAWCFGQGLQALQLLLYLRLTGIGWDDLFRCYGGCLNVGSIVVRAREDAGRGGSDGLDAWRCRGGAHEVRRPHHVGLCGQQGGGWCDECQYNLEPRQSAKHREKSVICTARHVISFTVTTMRKDSATRLLEEAGPPISQVFAQQVPCGGGLLAT